MKKACRLLCSIVLASASVLAGTITMVLPNGGENLVLGVKAPITWKYAGVSDSATVRVSLLQAGKEVGEIANNVPIHYNLSPLGTGALPDKWVVGAYQTGTVVAGCQYKIRVRVNALAVQDDSNSTFCITAPGAGATLKLTAPKGGEAWQLGSQQKITWTCTGYTNKLRIRLYKGFADWGVIAIPEAAANSYEWKVGDMAPPYDHSHTFIPGADYRIQLEAISGDLHDQSAPMFSIATSNLIGQIATIPPTQFIPLADLWIKVQSPTAGATLKHIDQYELRWQCSDLLKKKWAKVSLLKNNALYRVMEAKRPLISGYNLIQIPSDVPAGDYQIRIESLDWPDVKGDSGIFHVVLTEKVFSNSYDATTKNVFKYHHVWPSGAFTQACEGSEIKDPGPHNARVGYQNHKVGDDDWCHFIFRSHVSFEIKGLTGEVQSAKITFLESTPPPTLFTFYALTAAWDGNAGNLFTVPCKVVNLNDPTQLRDIVSNWVKNPGQNFGLVVVGDNESQAGSGVAVHYVNQIKLEVAEKVFN